MNFSNIVTTQYQNKVDSAAALVGQVISPPEAWLRTVRKALGMSAAQLARRMGKTRALISNTEKAELEGKVTLKNMDTMAKAMGCRFVYAIVPEHNVEELLQQQALKKAKQLVQQASTHMALEAQQLTEQQLQYEINRLQQDLLNNPPADFWDDY